MVITDNQLIGNSSYSNGSTVIMERRTEQAKASAESAISEKQASKSNTNDIAVIYEKSNPKEKSENLSESVKCGTSNAEKLSIKTTAKKEDPFGVAATLELTHSYVKDNNYATKYSADKKVTFWVNKAEGGIDL